MFDPVCPMERTLGKWRKSTGAPAREVRRISDRLRAVPKLTPEPPRTWLVSGTFTSGVLANDAPAHVVAAQLVAVRLDAALATSGRTRVEVAASAGIARSTLYAIVSGNVFPDFVSVARLSAELGTSLWPVQ